MAGYFEEMGWQELSEGEQPNHHLHLARYLVDSGIYGDNFTGQWPNLPPPASVKIVNSLRDIIIDKENENCPICLKKFSVGEKVKEVPCHHMFHATCILTWLAKTNSCPFCRYELPTDNEAYEAFKKNKMKAGEKKEYLDLLHNSMFS